MPTSPTIILGLMPAVLFLVVATVGGCARHNAVPQPPGSRPPASVHSESPAARARRDLEARWSLELKAVPPGSRDRTAVRLQVMKRLLLAIDDAELRDGIESACAAEADPSEFDGTV